MFDLHFISTQNIKAENSVHYLSESRFEILYIKLHTTIPNFTLIDLILNKI